MMNGDEEVCLRGGSGDRGGNCGVPVGQAGGNRDVELIEPGAAESRESDCPCYTADGQP